MARKMKFRGGYLNLPDGLRFLMHKNRRRLKKTGESGWGGFSVLIFPEDARSQLKQFRINYFILIFFSCLFLFLPLASIGLRFQDQWSQVTQNDLTATRHRLLESSLRLTLEKKEILNVIQKQLNRFHKKFSTQQKYSLATSLAEKNFFSTVQQENSKPGLHRSRYELRFLMPLRKQMAGIVMQQVPFVFQPLWNLMGLYSLTPRGWALLGGVGHVTSLYGSRKNPIEAGSEFHSGVDFAYTAGTPIIATAPGVVIRAVAVSKSGYGKFVRIHHGFGFTSLYAHCQNIIVEEGEFVKRGQVIAYLGRTGRTTGDHLHYEIQLGLAQAVNPLPYIKLK